MQKNIGTTLLSASEWDEAALLDWEQRNPEWAAPHRSGGRIGRALSLLRRIVWLGQRDAGMRREIRDRAPPCWTRRGRDVVRPIPAP